jgi:hypothetical protein
MIIKMYIFFIFHNISHLRTFEYFSEFTLF